MKPCNEIHANMLMFCERVQSLYNATVPNE